MSTLATQLTNQFTASEQARLEDEDEEEVVASDESPRVGHVPMHSHFPEDDH